MKIMEKPKYLPLLCAVLGVAGLTVRRGLYAVAVDQRGLLTAHHPLEIALWLLTAAVLALIVSAVWKQKGSNRYIDNFGPSAPAAAGQVLAAAGIALTVIGGSPKMTGLLGTLWTVLGLASVPCLALAGFARLKGRRPFFLLHMIPCLFLAFHIVDNYRSWSGDPQLQDYLFALLGFMALTFFAFYNAAFDVGSGRRRMQLGMGLAAVYLCFVDLAQADCPWLDLGGIAWAATGLCALDYRPQFLKNEKDGDAS